MVKDLLQFMIIVHSAIAIIIGSLLSVSYLFNDDVIYSERFYLMGFTVLSIIPFYILLNVFYGEKNE